jgi:hypothetical protein
MMETNAPKNSIPHKFSTLHQQLIKSLDRVSHHLQEKLDAVEDDGGFNRLDEIYLLLDLANHGLIELDQAILGIKPSLAQRESKAVSLMALDHLRYLNRTNDPDRILTEVRSSIKVAFTQSADRKPTNLEIDDAIRRALVGKDQKRDRFDQEAEISV